MVVLNRSVLELLCGARSVAKLALLYAHVSPELPAGGSVAFTGAQGSMQNKRQVVVQLKKGSDGLVPDFSLVLASPSAACREVKLERQANLSKLRSTFLPVWLSRLAKQ
jgi:hypothetical protein